MPDAQSPTDTEHSPKSVHVFGVVLLSLQVLLTLISGLALITSPTQYKEAVAVFSLFTGLLLLVEAWWLRRRDRCDRRQALARGDDPDTTGGTYPWDTPFMLGLFGSVLVLFSTRALLPPSAFVVSLSIAFKIPIEYAVTTGRALGVFLGFAFALHVLYRTFEPEIRTALNLPPKK